MSPIRNAPSPTQSIACMRQRPLLSFLYQTRTLLSGQQAASQPTRLRACRQPNRYLCTSKSALQSRKNIPSGSDLHQHRNLQRRPPFVRWSPAQGQTNKADPSLVRWSPEQSQTYEASPKKLEWSSTPSESPRALEPALHAAPGQRRNSLESSEQERKPPRSTLTASEQAVFNQLFSEISQNKWKTAEQKSDEQVGLEQESLDDVSMEDEDFPGSPRDQLAAIFEEALSRMKNHTMPPPPSSSQKSDRLKDKTYAKALDIPADYAGSAMPAPFRRSDLEETSRDLDEEADAHLKRAGDDHRHLVDSLLSSAKNDTEIWGVLEKEVFSLMTQLTLQIKHEETARRVELRKRKKAAKLSNETNTASATLHSTIESRSATTSSALPHDATTESKALNTTTLLYILKSNYAHHALEALRRFRTLELSSSYALALLPRIKSLGHISYVLGASAPLYNELLFQKWIQYSDVQGLAGLMQEMINQGITPDLATLEFVRFVDRSRSRDLRGINGAAKKSWWSLRPVREGWIRVKNLYVRFLNEVGDAARREMETLQEGRRKRLDNNSVAQQAAWKNFEPIEGGQLRRVTSHLTTTGTPEADLPKPSYPKPSYRTRRWSKSSSSEPADELEGLFQSPGSAYKESSGARYRRYGGSPNSSAGYAALKEGGQSDNGRSPHHQPKSDASHIAKSSVQDGE